MGKRTNFTSNFFDVLKILFLLIVLVTWPLSFVLNNREGNFLFYFAPAILLLISWLLYFKKNDFWLLPLIFIGLVNNLLIFFPVIVVFGSYFFISRNRINLIITILALLVLAFGFKNYKSDSVFFFSQNDYQKMIRNTYLYPDVYTARLFQNKPSIYWERIKFNFFALVDQNNYFFHFHPREIIVDNQNLDKFPFAALPFFLVGIYFFRKSSEWKFVALVLGAAIFNLSIIRNFDRMDLVLILPIYLIILHGFNVIFEKRSVFKISFLFVLLLAGLTEILHILVRTQS